VRCYYNEFLWRHHECRSCLKHTPRLPALSAALRSLTQKCVAGPAILLRRETKVSDPGHPLRLLRASHARPDCRAADEREELATFHLTEFHLVACQAKIAGYRISRVQSAGTQPIILSGSACDRFGSIASVS
jgi:hypothetical protein